MKLEMLVAGGLVLSLAGTGCATKKYVAQQIAPIKQQADAADTKNTDQDKQLAAHTTEINDVERDLSRTKENLQSTDAKAVAAGEAAKQADSKAQGAQQAADGARTLAQQDMDRTVALERTVDSVKDSLKFQMVKSDMVLFGVNQKILSKDAKASLDEFAKAAEGQDRFVIEVQGFTDKTGPAVYNDELSQERAEAVARYLANQHKVPLRSITLLGTGIASGDQKTREERKQNRRVEVRIFVPETVAGNTARNTAGQ